MTLSMRTDGASSPAHAMTVVLAMAEADLAHELGGAQAALGERGRMKGEAREAVRACVRRHQDAQHEMRTPRRAGNFFRRVVDRLADGLPGLKGTRDRAADRAARIAIDIERQELMVTHQQKALDDLKSAARGIEDSYEDSRSVVDAMRRELEAADSALREGR